MKYSLRLTTQFAPLSNTYKGMTYDQTRVWAVLREERDDPFSISFTGGHHIPNVFDITNETLQEELPELSTTICKIWYTQHSTCLGAKLKEYDSVESYWADPSIKKACIEKFQGGVDYSLANDSDPTSIDMHVAVTLDGYPDVGVLSFKSVLYDTNSPTEWYSEAHDLLIKSLRNVVSYDTAEKAIKSMTLEQDLFGDRYFPVLKAPQELETEMADIASSFKSCSRTLTDGENIYIGIRSKTHEIGYIHDIYEAGGTILVDTQWDW